MLALYFDIDVFVWLMTGFACLLSWQQPVRKPQKCLYQHLCQFPVCPQVRPSFLSNPPNESFDTLFTLKSHLSLANMWDCISPWAISRKIKLRHLASLAASLAALSNSNAASLLLSVFQGKWETYIVSVSMNRVFEENNSLVQKGRSQSSQL